MGCDAGTISFPYKTLIGWVWTRIQDEKEKCKKKKHYIYFVKLMTKPFLPRLQFFKEHLGQ
jgi:hypothetical protein